MKILTKILLVATVATSLSVPQVQAQFQVAPNKYAIKFTDKNECGYSIDKPQEFLSEKALARRAKFNIEIDEFDLPVNQNYVDKIQELGFKIHGVSKWYNCVVVVCDSAKIATLKDLNLPFVDTEYQWCKPKDKPTQNITLKRPKLKFKPKPFNEVYDYGDGAAQARMLNIPSLHAKGFDGKGLTIAVCDAGFFHANELPAFKQFFAENRMLGIHDFVDLDSSVYEDGMHGMNVLSCIVGEWSGNLVGTAPKASAYLFRTEDENTENIVEEFNFTFACEKADSLGVDMIHASLGYQDFDDKNVSYVREQVDGNTTIGSVSADRAASRGIVITISAGNNGDKTSFPWITSPADADSVLAVGAVHESRKLAYFSARGMTVDGRVKPDVCAMGVMSAVQGTKERIVRSSGTSFSGPIMAGAILSLMQAHPDAPVIEILNAVRLSGDKWDNPNKDFGYGIPDFEIAHQILLKKKY